MVSVARQVTRGGGPGREVLSTTELRRHRRLRVTARRQQRSGGAFDTTPSAPSSATEQPPGSRSGICLDFPRAAPAGHVSVLRPGDGAGGAALRPLSGTSTTTTTGSSGYINTKAYGTSYGCGALGRRTSVELCRRHQVRVTYDAAGNTISSVKPRRRRGDPRRNRRCPAGPSRTEPFRRQRPNSDPNGMGATGRVSLRRWRRAAPCAAARLALTAHDPDTGQSRGAVN